MFDLYLYFGNFVTFKCMGLLYMDEVKKALKCLDLIAKLVHFNSPYEFELHAQKTYLNALTHLLNTALDDVVDAPSSFSDLYTMHLNINAKKLRDYCTYVPSKPQVQALFSMLLPETEHPIIKTNLFLLLNIETHETQVGAYKLKLARKNQHYIYEKIDGFLTSLHAQSDMLYAHISRVCLSSCYYFLSLSNRPTITFSEAYKALFQSAEDLPVDTRHESDFPKLAGLVKSSAITRNSCRLSREALRELIQLLTQSEKKETTISAIEKHFDIEMQAICRALGVTTLTIEKWQQSKVHDENLDEAYLSLASVYISVSKRKDFLQLWNNVQIDVSSLYGDSVLMDNSQQLINALSDVSDIYHFKSAPNTSLLNPKNAEYPAYSSSLKSYLSPLQTHLSKSYQDKDRRAISSDELIKPHVLVFNKDKEATIIGQKPRTQKAEDKRFWFEQSLHEYLAKTEFTGLDNTKVLSIIFAKAGRIYAPYWHQFLADFLRGEHAICRGISRDMLANKIIDRSEWQTLSDLYLTQSKPL